MGAEAPPKDVEASHPLGCARDAHHRAPGGPGRAGGSDPLFLLRGRLAAGWGLSQARSGSRCQVRAPGADAELNGCGPRGRSEDFCGEPRVEGVIRRPALTLPAMWSDRGRTGDHGPRKPVPFAWLWICDIFARRGAQSAISMNHDKEW